MALPRTSALLGVLVVSYGACLVFFVALKLPQPSRPAPPEIVLRPLVDSDEAAREVDTHVGRAHLRRLCANGRCELLAGRSASEGFSLLASYPAHRWVGLDLDAEGALILRDITDGPPREPEARRWAAAFAYATLMLGPLALVVLARMRGALREELARYIASRPALVTTSGTLRFLDASSPAMAHTSRPLPPGPATALHEISQPASRGPYRHGDSLWLALPGARDQAIARLAAARGALAALGTGIAASGALALLIALA